jgi:hypothetical protein
MPRTGYRNVTISDEDFVRFEELRIKLELESIPSLFRVLYIKENPDFTKVTK